ncbi:MAG: competence/damage-inducible protein A [Gammaproteobacteria bacterium]|nr:competence/damage-inducible protein A [Gammaproteobacteria bacterium]MCP5318733.1 competence/damage-inducible protein A [Chromatiaceae bacterium]MCP5429822.1 competence/damage-inducible protein A [Chromatiaceae bacterium]MCP5435578.1 competence/damage-inducible protein A [Chromatiaceae bacterium]
MSGTPASDAFGIIVVGDEILNGRRSDRHFDGIGGLLRERGFKVAWLRILPDDPEYLVSEFARTMAEGIPVFCCGGIGATPDDHTRACAARAAGVALSLHPGAVAEIEGRFGAEAYPNRIKMAELPLGSELIPNPYNRIPGFSINRHYFMPGFPDMAHPMAAWVLDNWFAEGGHAERQCAVRVRGVTESSLMDLMQQLVERFPEAKLFSLPRLGAEFQIELGFRGRCDLEAPLQALMAGLEQRGVTFDRLDD